MIRLELPAHLRILAHVTGEVQLEVEGRATVRSVSRRHQAAYSVASMPVPEA